MTPAATAHRAAFVAACRFPAPRGSQVLIDEMASAFARSGVDTHLVAPLVRRLPRPYRTHAVTRRSGLAPPADPLAWPRLARAFFDAALAARLDAVVRRERLSVVHAHNFEGLAAALLVRRLRGIPVVFHAHAMLADELPLYAGASPGERWRARRFGAWCDRTLPRLADRVVALSADVATYLAACGVERERISVIPPGLDPGPFGVPSQRAGRAAEARPRAVFAGNLDAYQNVELLLDAWSEVLRRHAAAELSLVTHAPTPGLEPAIARRRLTAGVRVVRARSLAEVSSEIASATVGVSPRSSWSGFPIKTLNYMAAGIPTVALAASAKGIHDGLTGWVVPESTPAAFAAALGDALEDPVASALRGRAAREALRDAHSWERLTPLLRAVSERSAAGL